MIAMEGECSGWRGGEYNQIRSLTREDLPGCSRVTRTRVVSGLLHQKVTGVGVRTKTMGAGVQWAVSVLILTQISASAPAAGEDMHQCQQSVHASFHKHISTFETRKEGEMEANQ